jgi:hypothetical protein
MMNHFPWLFSQSPDAAGNERAQAWSRSVVVMST